jgi:predicted outer membrane repeat protein
MKRIFLIYIALQLSITSVVCAQTITSIAPATGNGGATVSVVITLNSSVTPPLPPATTQPTSVAIGSIEATSKNRTSSTSISATFTIPQGVLSGNFDVTVKFSTGTTGNVTTYTLVNGFQFVGGAPTVFYVDGGSGNDSNTGLAWASSKKTIQSAIDEASKLCGGIVWVKSGTYKPTTTTDRTISVNVKPNVQLYGGFAGTETLIDQRNATTNVTILSGDIGTVSNNSDNSYHVILTSKNSKVDGFSITDGNANGEHLYRMGGGIYLANDIAIISNCKFFNNYAEEGAAMYVFNINGATSGTSDIVTIENCSFSNNAANNGGAVVLRVGASSNITNCQFTSNTAEWRGGAIFIDYGATTSAPITIKTCTFSGNSTKGNGGAIYCDDMASQHNGTYWFVNSCVFTNNSATYRGGAISNFNSNNFPTLSSNTFSGNTAGAGGTAISNDNGVSLTYNSNNTLESGQNISSDSASKCTGCQ